MWVNSESDIFGQIAKQEGVNFHKRPDELANDTATSEDFINEFLLHHECDYIVQVHSIAPLMSIEDVKRFVTELKTGKHDVLLSVEEVQIECAFKGEPVNFTYASKTNSQELTPIQRITWSITAWKHSVYLDAYSNGKCATYSGNVGYFPINKLASHIIKTAEDLEIARALWRLQY